MSEDTPRRDTTGGAAIERRMNAYYYGFTPTGVDAVDKILSAVACAGKAFHHTEDWSEAARPYADHTGTSPVDWIQHAANEAAERFTALLTERERGSK